VVTGLTVGWFVGLTVGALVVGSTVGSDVGPAVGSCVGAFVGSSVVTGLAVGSSVGSVVGSYVGLEVGSSVVWNDVGDIDGMSVLLVVLVLFCERAVLTAYNKIQRARNEGRSILMDVADVGFSNSSQVYL